MTYFDAFGLEILDAPPDSYYIGVYDNSFDLGFANFTINIQLNCVPCEHGSCTNYSCVCQQCWLGFDCSIYDSSCSTSGQVNETANALVGVVVVFFVLVGVACLIFAGLAAFIWVRRRRAAGAATAGLAGTAGRETQTGRYVELDEVRQ